MGQNEVGEEKKKKKSQNGRFLNTNLYYSFPSSWHITSQSGFDKFHANSVSVD